MNKETTKKPSAIILLSGGLDSLVSLAKAIETCDIKLALTFNYGQKSFKNELEASEKICEHYGIKHQTIKLDFLQEITQSALVKGDVPELSKKDIDSKEITQNSMKAVWVPNRNGLFLNISASFADSYGYDFIIFGGNKEEASTFPDNTEEFTEAMTKGFELSTQKKPKVIAPLIKLSKSDIVKTAIELEVPLELTRSCYNAGEKNCGQCESCQRLKRALSNNTCFDLIDKIF